LVALSQPIAHFTEMTKSCATHKGQGRDLGRGAALAVQGGGAHGAFTWGVLDRLLEEGLQIDAICGVSLAALIGVALAQGLVRGGPGGARAAMRELWHRFAQAHAMSQLQSAPRERSLWGWDMSNSLIWRGLEATMRMFSPAQLNPFGHQPLRALLTDLVDPALLADPAAPRLIVSATDVEAGEAALFENTVNTEITVDVLLASCCLPFVFPAVEIGGRAYWDGGYSDNPPLKPLLAMLLAQAAPRDLLLVRAQPAQRPGVPRTPRGISNRLNEIACHNVLAAELAALPAGIVLTRYDADAALFDLPISFKFNGEEEFLSLLFTAGRAAAAIQGVPRSAAGRPYPKAASPRMAAPQAAPPRVGRMVVQ
jgi:NTE family protein